MSYLLLAFTFSMENANSAMAIIGLAAFLSFFSAGMGPGAWLIPAEVFSTVIRAKGMSLATFMNRVTATIVTSTFLSLANYLSYGGFFVLLAFINLGLFGFFSVFLPETKGRSLEEMSVYFAELTGDESVLEAERKLREIREQDTNASRTQPPVGSLA